MSRAVLPSKAHVKQGLRMLDLGIKVEFLLSDLISVLFWSSSLDILFFLLGLVMFIIDSSDMAAFWWFTPHVVRGVIGVLLVSWLPKTHDIIK